MKNQKKTELKVGITVIVSIVILLWVLGWAKNFSFSSNEKTISISFQNVAGLVVGDVVSVQGIKEGYVKSIHNENNSIIVEATLSEMTNLKEDARFSIMMIDLMGGKKIEIAPGISDKKIDYSQIQKGEFLGDISTSMAALGAVQDDLVEVIYEIKATLTSFNKIMGNPEFIHEIENSVASLNNLIIKTDKIISENGDSFSELLSNSNQLVASSNKFIVENGADLKTSINNINEVLKNTNKLIVKLSGFFDEVENQENNLGKLMYDEELVKDLSATLKQLKELSNMINKQLNNKGLKVDADVF
jgi:phospholipid/cholesterol/gamma-HCH transport system substrate-binding protein